MLYNLNKNAVKSQTAILYPLHNERHYMKVNLNPHQHLVLMELNYMYRDDLTKLSEVKTEFLNLLRSNATQSQFNELLNEVTL